MNGPITGPERCVCHEPPLLLKQVSLHLNGQTILKALNLRLEPGECLALIGPSGAGKSSLLSMLAGAFPGCSTGEVRYLGGRCIDYPGNSVALLPQGLADNLNPHMTVFQHLKDGLSVHARLSRRQVRERAQQLMSQASLPQTLLNRYPRHLSGGEVQRVLLALALASNPGLLLLDEPTAALDPGTRECILQQLKQQKHERSLVLATHDMELARQLADRVCEIRNGRIIQNGRPDEVLLTGSSQTQQTKHIRTRSASRRAVRSRVVELKNMTLNFGQKRVFRKFEVGIDFGSLRLVHGASGSGKTTLARLLAGWDALPAGARLNRRGRCLLLSQHAYSACPRHFTLRRILSEPLALQGQPVDVRVLRGWLQKVQLPDDDAFLQRRSDGLSGGELQRLLIARAMIARPDLLIADEPTSALNPDLRDDIARLLLSVRRETGCGLLVFSHDESLCRLLGVEGEFLRPGGLSLARSALPRA
ncbi:MAG: ABC transporter ATP-binding protein [Alteromonadaceae bacterium]|nr:ABC transporter ATP-binding protein [Alteromonadaceae bacterium]